MLPNLSLTVFCKAPFDFLFNQHFFFLPQDRNSDFLIEFIYKIWEFPTELTARQEEEEKEEGGREGTGDCQNGGFEAL